MDPKIKLICLGFVLAVVALAGWLLTSPQNNHLAAEESNVLLQSSSTTILSDLASNKSSLSEVIEPSEKRINLSARFLETWVFNVSVYNVTEAYNFSFIVIPKLFSEDGYGELALPVYRVNTVYPLQTVITNVTILSAEDPVDLSLPNLPMRGRDTLVSRLGYDGKCISNAYKFGLTYKYAYAPDRLIFGMTLNPVEVVDCEKGLFRLYKKITFGVYYYVHSPVLLDVAYYPKHVKPREKINLPVKVINVINETVPGTIFLDLKGVGRVFEQNISVDSAKEATYNISFEMPRKEGEYQYDLGYYLYNETRVNQSFWPYISE
jgi:hypothetical protein